MLLNGIKAYIKLRDRKDIILKPLVDRLPDWLTPNILTTVRLFFILPFFYMWWLASDPYIVWQWWHWLITAIIAFIYPATDYLDGAIARFKNKITAFGTYYDPIVDKLYSVPLLLFLAWIWPHISAFYFLIVVRLALSVFVVIRGLLYKYTRINHLMEYAYIISYSIAYSIFVIWLINDIYEIF